MRAKRLGEEIVQYKRKKNKSGQLGISWKVEHLSEDIVSRSPIVSSGYRLHVQSLRKVVDLMGIELLTEVSHADVSSPSTAFR
jgi:hypothetical protein